MFYGLQWEGMQNDMMREKQENMILIDGFIDLDIKFRIQNLVYYVQNFYIKIRISKDN